MKSSPSVWHYVVNVKSTVKISAICVAFLENMNFKQISRKNCDALRLEIFSNKKGGNKSQCFFPKAKQSRNDSNSPHWSLNHVHEVHGTYKVIYQVQ